MRPLPLAGRAGTLVRSWWLAWPPGDAPTLEGDPVISPASAPGRGPAGSGLPSLILAGRRCQVVHAVLTSVGDQQGRSTVDVVGQQLHGSMRVAGEGEFLELPVFPGQVALVIVGEHPVPPAVELGAVPERGGDRLESAVAAAGQQGLVEVAVLNGPVLVELSVVPADGCPLKTVVRGQDTGLPLQVAALDRQAQGERFDLDAGLGQLGDVLDRQVAHPEAALRRGGQQALLGQAGGALPADRLAPPGPFGKLDHLQLLAGIKNSVEQLRPKNFVHLFGAGCGSGGHLNNTTYFCWVKGSSIISIKYCSNDFSLVN